MSGTEFSHIPVMLSECIDGLAVKNGGIYVDGTLGGCGHSAVIQKNGGKVIGIDRDTAAIENAKRNFPGIVTVHDNYSNILNILNNLGIEKIDGALLDLGVSSYQLDTPDRGFSYRFDAPLDMRMDTTKGITAFDVVNGYSVKELERIFFSYGEEQYSKAIAQRIDRRRKLDPIKTTAELAEIITEAVPPKARRAKHPAKKVFQAIRIEVNGELDILEQALTDFVSVLNPGGRLAVITFHSLEDRAVKTTFNKLIRGCECPPEFPVCVCGKKPQGTLLTKKPILPSKDELTKNPRSASAKLRIFVKAQ